MIAIAIPSVAQATEGSNAKSKNSCGNVRQGVEFYRGRTWRFQSALGYKHTPTAFAEKAFGCRYITWAANLWRERSRNNGSKFRSLNRNPRKAICFVFGRYCSQALSVSACETGHTYYIGASNGQYLGLFQMGSSERRLYGHGYTALEQARAAYAYFRDSGYDWSPWSCKP